MNIRVMMRHKPAASVHFSCYASAILPYLLQKGKKRHMTVGEIAALHVPVIHFSIDVNRILAVPGRCEILVPKSLQGSRQTSLAAARNGQISTEIKEQLAQTHVSLTVLCLLQTLVSGQAGKDFSPFQFKSKAVVKRFVIRNVLLQQLLIAETHRLFKPLFQLSMQQILQCRLAEIFLSLKLGNILSAGQFKKMLLRRAESAFSTNVFILPVCCICDSDYCFLRYTALPVILLRILFYLCFLFFLGIMIRRVGGKTENNFLSSCSIQALSHGGNFSRTYHSCLQRHGKLIAAPSQISVKFNAVVTASFYPVKKLTSAHPCGKINGARSRRRKTHDNTVCRFGGKYLPTIDSVSHTKFRCGHSCF